MDAESAAIVLRADINLNEVASEGVPERKYSAKLLSAVERGLLTWAGETFLRTSLPLRGTEVNTGVAVEKCPFDRTF